MIRESKVLIKINHRNSNYYRELGYIFDLNPSGQSISIEVPIEHINKTSKVKITAICDLCKSENNIMFSKYWVNFSRHNFYSCFKCKNKKKEMTSIQKYGTRSYSETEEFKLKFKETSMLRYGVDNPNKTKECRDKIKNTNIQKYGYETILVSPENIEKNKIWMSSDKFKEKSKNTMIKKYGKDHYSKTDDFKNHISLNKSWIVDKIKKTFIDKYGEEWYSKTESFRKAIKTNIDKELNRKETCLLKYGVDNVSKVDYIYNKIYQSKLYKGIIVDSTDLTRWELYKRNVRRLTNKVKKKLYEDWNGYDYYDNEFIKGYLSLNHLHRFYPTVDHKISTYYGFVNNISELEISDISNLCITKRFINSTKHLLTEEVFLSDCKS